jgi:YCF9.
LLVIGVPVVLASPDGWSSSKNTVFLVLLYGSV